MPGAKKHIRALAVTMVSFAIQTGFWYGGTFTQYGLDALIELIAWGLIIQACITALLNGLPNQDRAMHENKAKTLTVVTIATGVQQVVLTDYLWVICRNSADKYLFLFVNGALFSVLQAYMSFLLLNINWVPAQISLFTGLVAGVIFHRATTVSEN